MRIEKRERERRERRCPECVFVGISTLEREREREGEIVNESN